MPIDFDKLLNEPRFRRRVSKRRLAQYERDESRQKIHDDYGDESEMVLCLDWSGSFPGAAGASWIYEWKGFYFFSSSDYSPEGPFPSLDRALRVDSFNTSTAGGHLESETISDRKLWEIALGLVSSDGDEIRINDSRFVLEEGRLRKLKQPAEAFVR